jgi:hypothetical protein
MSVNKGVLILTLAKGGVGKKKRTTEEWWDLGAANQH